MDIQEEDVQEKGIHNIFNKVITENFPNLKLKQYMNTKPALQKIL
jgi:hypothetical protein